MPRPPQKIDLVIIRAIDPESVLCPESILVSALTTLGVPEHPDRRFAYTDTRESLPNGAVRRILQWSLLTKSKDGVYKTNQLMKWWHDPEWLRANPTHELAILKDGLGNMMRLGARIRLTPPIEVYRKGRHLAMIPTQLPEEKQKEALAKLAAA